MLAYTCTRLRLVITALLCIEDLLIVYNSVPSILIILIILIILKRLTILIKLKILKILAFGHALKIL